MYVRNGVELSERKHGEGVVKWLDADNVIFERHWYRVEEVHQESGRISITRFRWDDGNPTKENRLLTATLSRLKHRPTFRMIGRKRIET